jgi:hypothetical protein
MKIVQTNLLLNTSKPVIVGHVYTDIEDWMEEIDLIIDANEKAEDWCDMHGFQFEKDIVRGTATNCLVE